MKDEAPKRPPMRAMLLGVICASSFILHPSSFSMAAAPSQDDVLRSIGQNIDQQTGDPSKLLALLAAVGGLTILLVVIAQRHKREVTSKAPHHHGKLVKHVSRAIGLKPRELRRLRQLAEEQNVSSPLTLLLCPSLLRRHGGGDGNEATLSGSGMAAGAARRD